MGAVNKGKVKKGLVRAMKFAKNTLLPGVPKQSPIQMLTRHNIA
jgi:hypothetical protein